MYSKLLIISANEESIQVFRYQFKKEIGAIEENVGQWLDSLPIHKKSNEIKLTFDVINMP